MLGSDKNMNKITKKREGGGGCRFRMAKEVHT